MDGSSKGRAQTVAARKNIFSSLLAGIFISTVAFGSAGLTFLKNRFASTMDQMANDFRWVVPVSGGNLVIDEVGAFLRRMDGVKDVSYIPNSQIVKDLASDPMLADSLKMMDLNRLPPAWDVRWTVDGLNDVAMEIAAQDTMKFPGVLDVAYDGQTLRTIKTFRLYWLEVRFLIASLLVLGSALFLCLLGRFLFFIPVSAWKQSAIIRLFLFDWLWWAAGLGLFGALFQTVPWILLIGGLDAALFHYLILINTRHQ